MLRNPHERIGRLREGLNATARIILLGLVMDVIYQIIVLKTFYPVEAVIVALCLHLSLPCSSRTRSRRVSRGVARQQFPASGREQGHQAWQITDIAAGADRFEVRVTADSHFGWLRTRLSVERTMMSWLRTAVSLIGFGFAIVQFFERMEQMPGVQPPHIPDAPQYLGLALMSCGILALVISIWQYWWTVRYLWSGSFAPIAGMTKEGMQSPVLAVAVLLI